MRRPGSAKRYAWLDRRARRGVRIAKRTDLMSVEELEQAVSRLSTEELNAFSGWFEEYLADQWDQQIEADAHAGRLDAAGQRADEDFEAGRVTPL